MKCMSICILVTLTFRYNLAVKIPYNLIFMYWPDDDISKNIETCCPQSEF